MLMRAVSIISGDGLRARSIRSSGMTLISVVGSQFLRLASNLILTRLLFPEAFGLMALVTVFLVGVTMMSDIGLNASVIQNKRGDDSDFLNVVWTLKIAQGICLCIITYILAEPVARFYEEPMLAPLLSVMAVVSLIKGFGSTSELSASRNLMLGRWTVVELVSQLIGILTMIFLAWALRSVWALVLGSIVAIVVKVILSHAVMPGIRNRLHFDRKIALEIFNFGKFVFFATFATFILTQADRAVLGRFVSLSDLAFYNIGFFLASAPVMLGAMLSNRVLFPLYARIPPSGSSNNRIKIFKARRLVTGAILAALAVMAIGGDWLVRVLYDPRYYGAGPLLTLIAVSAMALAITQSYGHLLLAAGRSGRYAIFMVTRATLYLMLLVPAAMHFGTIGVAITPLIAELLFYPIALYLIRTTQGWDWKHDLGFASVAVLVACIAFWVNAHPLAEALTQAGILASTSQ